MKNLSKLFFFFILAALSLTACNKTDYNDDDWAEEQRRLDSLDRLRVEALLEEQAPILASFVEENFPNDKEWRLDDSTGIWFKVHEPGEAGSYTRWLVPGSMGGLALANPTIEVKYVGKLLNGNIFDETSDDDPDKETLSSPLGGLITAWQNAFFPKEYNLNGNDYKIGGLTEKGLQKGAIIEFVAPSPYCYDNTESDDIPADSPLHFYIEVVDIK